MMFHLEEYCVVDDNRCEPGQIYCSQRCKELDARQPPSLEFSSNTTRTNSTASNDSIFSSSPMSSTTTSAFNDDDLLQTPRCNHHFMYDSKINHHNKCNCNKADDCTRNELSFLDLDFDLNSSYDLKNNNYTLTSATTSTIASAKYDLIPNVTSLMGILSRDSNSTNFEKELQENKHIKNSFKTAKDNYRLWLNNSSSK